MNSKKITFEDLLSAVDTNALASRPIPDWRPLLADEVLCYVCGENYLCRRFDAINFKFCEKNEAKEILIDNLYALLRFKYFTKPSEEIDERIEKIVRNFTMNIKTSLKKVSFDTSADCRIVRFLPDYCIAFRNGVYNFKDNKWLFKYDITNIEKLGNKIYMYDTQYIITWYMDYDFDPLPIEIQTTTLVDFIEIMKELTKSKKTRNYCFELLYNISHNIDDTFSLDKFIHLCEILGYSVLQSFSQYFVMLVGSGQNGKNSLFDGCFTHRVLPRPASNDLDSLENDRFVTGSLENKAQNIFLETSAKTYTESKMLKALTGSMYQTIESKGINKYSSIINCKYIFAGNDQDKIKFSDTTTGFTRRINMFEITYRWDSAKRFLKRGDYYDTSFSDTLSELKNDTANTTAYIYFAMYGIMNATKGFKQNFQFSHNDWNNKYSDIDFDLKERIDKITPRVVVDYLRKDEKTLEEAKYIFYDVLTKNRLYMSTSMKELGFSTIKDMLNMLEDVELCQAYFAENDVYMCVKSIQSILKDLSSSITFSGNLKKTYNIAKYESLYGNKAYVKCSFKSGKLKILNK